MFMKQNSSHKALWELYDNCVSVSDLLFLCVCKHRNKFRFVEVFLKNYNIYGGCVSQTIDFCKKIWLNVVV